MRKTACMGYPMKVLTFFIAVFGSNEDCPVDQDACKEAIPSKAELKIKSTVKVWSNLRKC